MNAFSAVEQDMEVEPIGHDHTISFTSVKGVEVAGAVIFHPDKKLPNNRHAGSILFDLPIVRAKFPSRPLWTLERIKPLTISPSVLCSCGDHGFIRDGKWVPA